MAHNPQKIFYINIKGILLTPLAPGSVVDACGGFLLVMVFGKHFHGTISFWSGWAIAVFLCCVLHWIGACAQWAIGRIPFVQVIFFSTMFLCVTEPNNLTILTQYT